MANQARVTTTDAFESFRANLIVFLSKARRSLDDASEETRLTRLWLQHDQRLHWEGEVRRRVKKLDQAQQELRNAQFTGTHDTALVVRQAAVNKAKLLLDEAEEKLRHVKKWNQNYDNTSDPVLKRLEGMRQFLESDLPKAIAYLSNAQNTLEQYADALPPEPTTPNTTFPDDAGSQAKT